MRSPGKAILTTCPHCKGAGTVPLSGRHRETLDLLRRQRAPLNGAALAKLAGIEATAMNQRLVKLEEKGLARGEWDGRQRLWTATDEGRGVR